MLPDLHIDLSLPPRERWQAIQPFAKQACEMIDCYGTEIQQALTDRVASHGGSKQDFESLLQTYMLTCVEPDYRAEMEGMADVVGRPMEQVVLGSLYYDAFQVAIGCTAFAVDTAEGPLHARNLDWWTVNDLLADNTQIVHYQRGAGEPLFSVVGWPGYIGALSGLAPKRFSLTLNSVYSQERSLMSTPISLLIRMVLERARDFKEAVQMLEQKTIVGPCLLLACGSKNGDMAVIERTPTRAVVRGPQNSYVAVTNEYQALTDQPAGVELQQILQTSCSRMEQVKRRLKSKMPKTPAQCLSVLRDPGVQMNITVQQMVFHPAQGTISIWKP